MKYTSENLVEMSSLRNQLIDRIEVLSKVKQLFMIPKLEMIPIDIAADFYEVDQKVIRQIILRHKEEIERDGVKVMSGKSVALMLQGVTPVNTLGKSGFDIAIDDVTTIHLNNGNRTYFSPRAVLRIGMLLRDSEVAKEVRTQLLNTFEAAYPAQRTQAIDEEGFLILDVIRASDDESRILSFGKYRDFMNRHIAALEEKNSDLNKELDIVYREIETWSNPEIVKKLVVATAYKLNWSVGWVWNKLYSRLYHNCGISLPIRKGKSKSKLSLIKDEEWPDVLREAAAFARLNGVDIIRCIGAENEKKIPKEAS